ncbi:MAG: lipopolysaccharide biosynthesis protein [Edaphobacter sp.]|nr:lipopolysaccharide biosynthesis protein [Edaphobacter sp.]
MTPSSECTAPSAPADWLSRARLLWQYRHTLARVTAIALVVSLGIAFVIPKRYKSIARIMPPDQQGSGAMLLAALTGRSGGLGGLGGLGSLAGGLLGGHTNTALYESLLESGTIGGRLIDRFDLQKVYRSRYRFTTAKHLANMTKITDDKKSGVITIAVQDTDAVRARDLAQAYLDELNNLLTRTSSSSARQERIFIESRLRSVGADLEQAQLALSEFSSKNSTIDLKEQTRGLVDAGARVQGELLVEQSGLQSLRQIYGDGNVRVRETEARIASLRRDLQKMAGTSAPLAAGDAVIGHALASADDKGELYPPLRQLPRLAVPYANLYRRVRVQETVFELLTQQYEMARIEEAKDVPVVTVLDTPGIPERKFFPPRLLLTLLLTFLAFAATAALIVSREHWRAVDICDARKELAIEILSVVRRRLFWTSRRGHGVA